jgi:hypothetical protein
MMVVQDIFLVFIFFFVIFFFFRLRVFVFEKFLVIVVDGGFEVKEGIFLIVEVVEIDL